MWRLRKAEVLRGRVGPEGSKHGWDLSWLTDGVRYCGGSDPPRNHQVQVDRGTMWPVWLRHGGSEVQP